MDHGQPCRALHHVCIIESTVQDIGHLLVQAPDVCTHSGYDARHITTWLARVSARVHLQDVEHVSEVQPNCSDRQQHLLKAPLSASFLVSAHTKGQ